MNMYSVVIPCYNTPISFHDNLSRLMDRFTQKQFIFEVILIDDCSQIQISYNPNELIKIYRNTKNLGQDKSIVEGIKKSKGNIIITIDDDFQFEIDDVFKGIDIKKKNQQLQLVAGVSKNIFRWLDIVAVLVYWIIKLRGIERISSLRIFDKKICERINNESKNNFFNLSIFLQYTSNKRAYFKLKRYSNNATRYTFMKLVKFLMTIFIYKPKLQ